MANLLSEEQLRKMCEDAAALGFRPERLMNLDRQLRGWIEQRKVSQGIVVKVVRHNQTAFEAAYGQKGAGEEEGPLTVDTIYPLCSQTKPITAALICIMQEEGLLDLTQRVRPHFPRLVCDTDSDIRLWQLLTHTSGLHDGDMWGYIDVFIKEKLEMAVPEEGAPDEVWDEICLRARERMELPAMPAGKEMRQDTFEAIRFSAPLTRKPHTEMIYAGAGYYILGKLISKISGKTIDEYAQEKLFGPLGMTDSYWNLPEEKNDRYYRRSSRHDGWRWLNDRARYNESGDNGIKSTVTDMCRFTQMFLNRGELDGVRIVSPATVDMMLTNYNAKLPDSFFNSEWLSPAWGLGWNIRCGKIDDAGMIRSDRSFQHGGFGGSMITGDPDRDVAIAYFGTHPTENPDWNWSGAHVNNMVLGAIDD
ncbi:MAG: beta-lactamase family protein [Oscillospiraceae bacterium]|nr:beta-lactamase family protein [Oscillospiraceae bacterium]